MGSIADKMTGVPVPELTRAQQVRATAAACEYAVSQGEALDGDLARSLVAALFGTVKRETDEWGRVREAPGSRSRRKGAHAARNGARSAEQATDIGPEGQEAVRPADRRTGREEGA